MLGDEDLANIFSSAGTFSTPGTFTTVVGPPAVTVAVYGIFTDATQRESIIGGEIETYDASFTCRTSDIAAIKRDMTVVISAVTYTVKRIQTLGNGTSLVTLKT